MRVRKRKICESMCVAHPCLRDAVRQGTRLNFLVLFLSREKEQRIKK